jgi:hypothetical protein
MDGMTMREEGGRKSGEEDGEGRGKRGWMGEEERKKEEE